MLKATTASLSAASSHYARPPALWRSAPAVPRSSGAPLPPRLLRHHRNTVAARDSIRGFEKQNANLLMDTISEELLSASLSAPAFLTEAAEQAKLPQGARLRFTGRFFQPVPWSPTTKHGMPQEFEVYRDPTRYLIILVPPNLVADALIRNGTRVCAVLEIEAAAADGGSGGSGGSSGEASSGGAGSGGGWAAAEKN